MSGIGHNKGPSMEPGAGFRKLAWTMAREALLPTLPLEVVRLRVKRAERLGLPYKTYATIRAVSGHDIVAFLFSSNALEIGPRRIDLPPAVAARLADLDGVAGRLAAAHRPLSPEAVTEAHSGLLEAACVAPDFTTGWGEARSRLRGFVRDARLSPDGVVLVAATAMEREWCAAAGFGGILPPEAVFASRA